MTGMDDLIEWALIQVAEDERVAREIANLWRADVYAELAEDDDFPVMHDDRVPTQEEARHVVRWDPARVLKLTAPLRKALDEFSWEGAESRILVGLVEALYSDRDGYREEWRCG